MSDGRVLTTDYLGFNSPQVLEDLGNLNNIEFEGILHYTR